MALPLERHYSIDELCVRWFGPRREFNRSGLKAKTHQKYHTVRRWFLDKDGNPIPGVMNCGNGNKVFLEVPESIALKVYEVRVKPKSKRAA